ncbi:hypothetical protein K0U27_10710 [archaeon]|nr:hypothetical protein [archaeon]
MNNELICPECGRYLAIGCDCSSSKLVICELCFDDFEDADTLKKHMEHRHKSQFE